MGGVGDGHIDEKMFLVGMSCETKLSFLVRQFPKAEEDALQQMFNESQQILRTMTHSLFPGGIRIPSDFPRAVKDTQMYLQTGQQIIYSPAFEFRGYRCRPDLVHVNEGRMEVYVVCNKAYKHSTFQPTQKRNPRKVMKEWATVVYRLSYVKTVVQSVLPALEISVHAVMPDMMIRARPHETLAVLGVRNEEELQTFLRGHDTPSILTAIPFDKFTDLVTDEVVEKMERMKEVINSEDIVFTEIGSKCRRCEYRVDERPCGYNLCMENRFGELDHGAPSVFDLWNFRSLQRAIEQGKYYLSDISEEDLRRKDGSMSSSSFRQLMQIQMEEQGGRFFDKEIISKLSSFQTPYQFVDFETASSPVPLMEGSFPEEKVLFQFSVHTRDMNGTCSHKDFLDTSGTFPSYRAVRELSKLLKRTGTVFIYSQYENTVLRSIKERLKNDPEPPEDAEGLVQFIDWFCSMAVDMLELVKDHYYHPMMRGSNSIKDVLPAVMSHSPYLREKYGKPYRFGSNFHDIIWYQERGGRVVDPYDLLEEMNKGAEIRHGEDAMLAYIRLISGRVDDEDGVRRSLLQYCELDTLAMLMIFEAWAADVSLIS